MFSRKRRFWEMHEKDTPAQVLFSCITLQKIYHANLVLEKNNFVLKLLERPCVNLECDFHGWITVYLHTKQVHQTSVFRRISFDSIFRNLIKGCVNVICNAIKNQRKMFVNENGMLLPPCFVSSLYPFSRKKERLIHSGISDIQKS